MLDETKICSAFCGLKSLGGNPVTSGCKTVQRPSSNTQGSSGSILVADRAQEVREADLEEILSALCHHDPRM